IRSPVHCLFQFRVRQAASLSDDFNVFRDPTRWKLVVLPSTSVYRVRRSPAYNKLAACLDPGVGLWTRSLESMVLHQANALTTFGSNLQSSFDIDPVLRRRQRRLARCCRVSPGVFAQAQLRAAEADRLLRS